MAYNPFNVSALYVNSSQYTTLALADDAAVSLGYGLNIDKLWTISSSTTLSASTIKFSGGTITLGNNNLIILGYLEAPATQIFSLNGSGHVDFTSSITPSAYIEWWGVQQGVIGSTTIDNTKASINAPLINSAISYGPQELLFLYPAPYSTTGHTIDGSHPHTFTGLGKSRSWGIIGSGIPYAYAADVVSSDPVAGLNMVFQNGVMGSSLHSQFNNITVRVSDPASVVPVFIGTSIATSTLWDIAANDCFFEGYSGWHWEWANENLMINNEYIGTVYGQSRVIPNISSVQSLSIQKITEINSEISCPTGIIYYENDPGASFSIRANSFITVSLESGITGLNINGVSTWITPHLERISGTLITGETSNYLSHWVDPDFGGPNSANQLLSQRGPRTVVEYGGNYFGSETGLVEALGGVQFSTTGDTMAQYQQSRTWTPSDASGASLTFTNVSCLYDVIGNRVFIDGHLTYPSTANGAAAAIGSLPFPVPNANYARGSFAIASTAATITTLGVLTSNTSQFTIVNDVAIVGITNAQLSGATLFFSFNYPIS